MDKFRLDLVEYNGAYKPNKTYVHPLNSESSTGAASIV